MLLGQRAFCTRVGDEAVRGTRTEKSFSSQTPAWRGGAIQRWESWVDEHTCLKIYIQCCLNEILVDGDLPLNYIILAVIYRISTVSCGIGQNSRHFCRATAGRKPTGSRTKILEQYPGPRGWGTFEMYRSGVTGHVWVAPRTFGSSVHFRDHPGGNVRNRRARVELWYWSYHSRPKTATTTGRPAKPAWPHLHRATRLSAQRMHSHFFHWTPPRLPRSRRLPTPLHHKHKWFLLGLGPDPRFSHLTKTTKTTKRQPPSLSP